MRFLATDLFAARIRQVNVPPDTCAVQYMYRRGMSVTLMHLNRLALHSDYTAVMNNFETGVVIAVVVVLALYHFQLFHMVRKVPAKTVIGQSRMLRQRWVASIIAERRDILAVQTMRNWTMAASLLSSTAILLAAGIGSFLLTADRLPVLADRLNYFGSAGEHLLAVKLMVLLAVLIFAFVNFTLAIRYFNHVSLDINAPAPEIDVTTIATRLLGRAMLHYTLGMRGFYFFIPAALWLFGPTWMLVGTLALLLGLWRLDRLN